MPASKHHFDKLPIPARQGIAASIGASCSAILTAPWDVIRVRQQYFCSNKGHISPFRLGRLIIQREGPRSLWRGLGSTLLMNIPASGLYFSIYEQWKEKFLSVNADLAPAMAGAAARSMMVAVSGPLELIRTNLQVAGRQGGHTSAVAVFRDTVKRNGLRGLWVGMGPNLARDVPFSAVYWYGFERFRASLKPYIDRQYVCNFISGAMSGCVASVFTNPFDVIKTKMQVQLPPSPPQEPLAPVSPSSSFSSSTSISSSSSSSQAPTSALPIMNNSSSRVASGPRRPTAAMVFRDIWEREGVYGFTAGLSARMIRVPIACAVMMSTYELFKGILI